MSKVQVALVDDHTMLRHGLATLINNMSDYTVIAESDNGKEFVEAVIKQKLEPEIILLDVSMPVMDGFETAHWIAAHLPLAKIIVLSMFDEEKNIIKMIRLGAKGYILKNGEPRELAAALNDVLLKGFHFNDMVSGKLVHTIHNNHTNGSSLQEAHITAREEEFLKLCCSEMTYKEIAGIMHLSSRTVEGYRDQLFEKLQLKTRVGLVLYAIKNKIVSI
jgi:two-component system, NarL family, invasion response regulator UvrY